MVQHFGKPRFYDLAKSPGRYESTMPLGPPQMEIPVGEVVQTGTGVATGQKTTEIGICGSLARMWSLTISAVDNHYRKCGKRGLGCTKRRKNGRADCETLNRLLRAEEIARLEYQYAECPLPVPHTRQERERVSQTLPKEKEENRVTT